MIFCHLWSYVKERLYNIIRWKERLNEPLLLTAFVGCLKVLGRNDRLAVKSQSQLTYLPLNITLFLDSFLCTLTHTHNSFIIIIIMIAGHLQRTFHFLLLSDNTISCEIGGILLSFDSFYCNL